MNPEIQIRKFKVTSDLDSAIEVYKHLCEFYRRNFNLEESIKFFKIRSYLEQYHTLCAIDEDKKRVVGLAFSEILTEEMQETSGTIKLIYVEEAYRKLGIMTKLINAMLDYFKEINIELVRVYLLKENLPYLRYFSEKLGFSPTITIVEKKQE